MDELRDRVTTLEGEMLIVKDDFKDFRNVLLRQASAFESLGQQISRAITSQSEVITLQRDSLPIGLVMKLFGFFTFIVIVLLGSVLGIKALADSNLPQQLLKHFL